LKSPWFGVEVWNCKGISLFAATKKKGRPLFRQKPKTAVYKEPVGTDPAPEPSDRKKGSYPVFGEPVYPGAVSRAVKESGHGRWTRHDAPPLIRSSMALPIGMVFAYNAWINKMSLSLFS
jgi:hypothetical protein